MKTKGWGWWGHVHFNDGKGTEQLANDYDANLLPFMMNLGWVQYENGRVSGWEVQNLQPLYLGVDWLLPCMKLTVEDYPAPPHGFSWCCISCMLKMSQSENVRDAHESVDRDWVHQMELSTKCKMSS